MRHTYLGFIILCLAGIVLAAAHFSPQAKPQKATIPSHAVEVAPGVFSLGKANLKGKIVEGYAIVNYKKAFGKPTGCNNNGVCQGWEDASCGDCSGGNQTESTCYSFLSKGAKWRAAEPYVVNPFNTEGLDYWFMLSNLDADIGKWESAAGTNIIGQGDLVNYTLAADFESPDGENEVYFGDVDQPGAIAITVVWGVFRGPPSQRELVEWDQVYDQADFDWSSTGEAGKMDFENIATHELGHSIGLGDLYETSCSEETMYGYADYGETKKRTLESGDIFGAQELYGN